MKRRDFALATFAAGAWLAGCSTAPSAPPAPSVPVAPDHPDVPPPAPREFRAAWVSTVANIDWPSKPGLPAAQQQREAIAILDRARALDLNAIVFQVRPAADALYASKIEPWSEYLTGVQGQSPGYDPLAFWVEQAHAHGLELHAWFNPYRARHSAAKSPLAKEHIANTLPDAVKAYGKFLWMDPGAEAASRQTLDVVLDVVRRYDIDGVHIDDYFYPYPESENGAEIDFPDQASWQHYLLGGGTLDKASWRRDNVNRLIDALYAGIHREKRWVRFGISPFGLPRPDRRPPGITGFSQYDKLYADAETWLQNGWLDYFTPQLYWPVAQAGQNFDALLDYWITQNTRERAIWPGLFTSRIGAPGRDYPPEEILQQIGITRSRPGASGHVHFSMAALMENRKGIADQLRATAYATPALVPAAPWLAAGAPAAPSVQARRAGKAYELTLAAAANVSHFAIWTRYDGGWRFATAPGPRATWSAPDDAAFGPASAIVISAVDRAGTEGPRVAVPAQAGPPAPTAFDSGSAGAMQTRRDSRLRGNDGI